VLAYIRALPGYIVLGLARNRFCENIGRHHKGNRVLIILQLHAKKEKTDNSELHAPTHTSRILEKKEENEKKASSTTSGKAAAEGVQARPVERVGLWWQVCVCAGVLGVYENAYVGRDVGPFFVWGGLGKVLYVSLTCGGWACQEADGEICTRVCVCVCVCMCVCVCVCICACVRGGGMGGGMLREQKCQDPDCRAVSFRSQKRVVPREIMASIPGWEEEALLLEEEAEAEAEALARGRDSEEEEQARGSDVGDQSEMAEDF
jgi:hypothetical protein